MTMNVLEVKLARLLVEYGKSDEDIANVLCSKEKKETPEPKKAEPVVSVPVGNKEILEGVANRMRTISPAEEATLDCIKELIHKGRTYTTYLKLHLGCGLPYSSDATLYKVLRGLRDLGFIRWEGKQGGSGEIQLA